MKLITQGIIVVLTVLLLQGCNTNKKSANNGAAVAANVNTSDSAYFNTPSIQDTGYMYRSPPAAAVQAHGLAR